VTASIAWPILPSDQDGGQHPALHRCLLNQLRELSGILNVHDLFVDSRVPLEQPPQSYHQLEVYTAKRDFFGRSSMSRGDHSDSISLPDTLLTVLTT